MKGQKDRTLKDELPRSVDAQYAPEEWRKLLQKNGENNSRNNEKREPKWKQRPVVDVTGEGRKLWWCRKQYCIGTWNVKSMN